MRSKIAGKMPANNCIRKSYLAGEDKCPMRRIKEALSFKTDKERLKWFRSLSEDEQAEITKDAKEIVENIINSFRPVVEAFME